MADLKNFLLKFLSIIGLMYFLPCQVIAAQQPIISNIVSISKASGMMRLIGNYFGQDPQVILKSDKGSQKIQPQSVYWGAWLSFKLQPSATGNLSVAVANGSVASSQTPLSLGQTPSFTRGYHSSESPYSANGALNLTSGNVLAALGATRTVSDVSISPANAAIQPTTPSSATTSLNVASQTAGSDSAASMPINTNTPNSGGGGTAVTPTPSVNKPANLAMITSVKPVIFNAPLSVKGGDIVGLQGENFGNAPKVQLVTVDGAQEVPVLNTYGGVWLSFRVPTAVKGFLAVQVVSDASTSDLVRLNAAKPYHLDATAISPGGAFRLFGSSLLMSGFIPKILVNGLPALIDVAKSSEHMLVVTAPSIIGGSAGAEVSVSNGSGDGFTNLDRVIAVIRGYQGDPFALGVGWASGFADINNKILNPLTSPVLKHHMVCDGHTDDSEALNDSINYLVGNGGGVVQLPDATCYLKYSVRLRSNVVLQGGGKDATTILYDFDGAIFGRDLEWVGIRNMTLKNNGGAHTGPSLSHNHFSFMQNIRVDLGESHHMWFADNENFVLKNCDVVMKENRYMQGPYVLNRSSGLVFEDNRTRFSMGAVDFEGVHDSVIDNNTFDRDALHQYSNPTIIHTIAINFAYRIALVNNQLNVLNGPVTKKDRNDGEAILTEGGGARRTENLGYVQSASTNSFTDKTNTINVTPFEQKQIPENYGVAIVAGKGMGQTRRVIAYSSGKATIDKPWDSIPDATSHYATFVWGLEKSIIANNRLNGNPRGIWLYQTAMREVDVVGNQITEGGGIYLRSAQNVKDKLFTPIYGVRIADNKISNQAKNWGSYINNFSVQMDPSDFGVSSIGVQIRNNTIVANRPNVINQNEDYSSNEGIMNEGKLEVKSMTPLNRQVRILGTIIQGNKCLNCPYPDYQAASQGTVFSQ